MKNLGLHPNLHDQRMKNLPTSYFILPNWLPTNKEEGAVFGTTSNE